MLCCVLRFLALSSALSACTLALLACAALVQQQQHVVTMVLTQRHLALKNLLAQRCQHESAFGLCWSCLNTDSEKCLRSVVLFRLAPEESSWRQLTSAVRKTRSALPTPALGCCVLGANVPTRVRYAHVIDSSAPAHDLSCRQRAWCTHKPRERYSSSRLTTVVQMHLNSENVRM